MKLYVMRHGQTDWNVLGKIQGCTDIELNETGILQAQNAKEEFDQYAIDLIFCSLLKRTKKTAEIINEDKKVPVICEEKIVERYMGEAEGVNPEEDEFFVQHDFWNYKANLKSRKIEPICQICDRVWSFLDELKEKYQDKNVLLVTHGGTAKVINSYFKGICEDGTLPKAGFQNCEIREYEL